MTIYPLEVWSTDSSVRLTANVREYRTAAVADLLNYEIDEAVRVAVGSGVLDKVV
jgi:hypothetical protein